MGASKLSSWHLSGQPKIVAQQQVCALLMHGVCVNPSKFLMRCVVCNGKICSVDDPKLKRMIFAHHQAPTDGTEALDVSQCNGCQQGHWFSSQPQSLANHAKDQATQLCQMCLRATVPVSASLGNTHVEHVNVEEEEQLGWD